MSDKPAVCSSLVSWSFLSHSSSIRVYAESYQTLLISMITIISIGMYRHHEVEDDDAILELMANLDARGVRKTEVHLSGLNRDDLNSMVSETLQIFPRLSMSFSDTILQKTSGNPFFAREYMKSLVDSRMLKYSLRQRRWIWDGDKISSDSTTDNNVLRLLSNKMCLLPERLVANVF